MYNLIPLSEELGGDATWVFPNGPLKIPGLEGGRAWLPLQDNFSDQYDATLNNSEWALYRPPKIKETYQKVRIFLDELESQYDEIILGGFSQGAILSTEMSLRAIHKPKALILLSGSLFSKKEWSEWAGTCRGLKFFQSHGEYDPILTFKQGRALFEFLMEYQLNGEFHKFSGQHEIPLEVLQSLRRFLSQLNSITPT